MVITITKLAGPNAVVNGVFVDPETATATFVKEDTTTQGNWIGGYGSQGYDIVSGPTSLPSYAVLTTSGASTYTWSNRSKPSVLQLPGSSNRVAAVWYSATNFSISLNLTDGQTHYIALYACDYDNLVCLEQIEITNAATGAILEKKSISSFSGGVYLQWRVSGSVVITITKLVGPNAVVNGVFVDPETATATFVKEDTTTQGNWIGGYGSQGYDIVSGPTSLPSYAVLTTSGASTYTWSNPNKPSVPSTSGQFQSRRRCLVFGNQLFDQSQSHRRPDTRYRSVCRRRRQPGVHGTDSDHERRNRSNPRHGEHLQFLRRGLSSVEGIGKVSNYDQQTGRSQRRNQRCLH